MNWIYFIAGFLLFPFLGGIILLWFNRKFKVKPVVITQTSQLHKVIGNLFRIGEDGQTVFIMEPGTKFLVRIIKNVRKTKDDTLIAEIRASDDNALNYSVAKSILEAEGITFDEKLTPKRKQPSRLYIKNAEGGIYTVSALVNVVSKIMVGVSAEQNLNLLASDQEPYFWLKVKT